MINSKREENQYLVNELRATNPELLVEVENIQLDNPSFSHLQPGIELKEWDEFICRVKSDFLRRVWVLSLKYSMNVAIFLAEVERKVIYIKSSQDLSNLLDSKLSHAQDPQKEKIDDIVTDFIGVGEIELKTMETFSQKSRFLREFFTHNSLNLAGISRAKLEDRIFTLRKDWQIVTTNPSITREAGLFWKL